MFRRAAGAERGTFLRLLQTLQHQPADALGWLLYTALGHAKLPLGIERGVRRVQTETAAGNFADSAPLARHDTEDVADELLRGPGAFAAHRARGLVFDLCAARLLLLDAHEHTVQNVQGLKARDHDRHAVFGGDGQVILEPHHRADVAGGQKALYPATG